MSKNEQIAYTAGWISASYPVKQPRYRDEFIQQAFDRGFRERQEHDQVELDLANQHRG